MVTQIKIHCDLCNKQLDDNEMKQDSSFLNFGGKPKQRYSMRFTYDGYEKKGDLCFPCAKKLRDFIDEMKQHKK